MQHKFFIVILIFSGLQSYKWPKNYWISSDFCLISDKNDQVSIWFSTKTPIFLMCTGNLFRWQFCVQTTPLPSFYNSLWFHRLWSARIKTSIRTVTSALLQEAKSRWHTHTRGFYWLTFLPHTVRRQDIEFKSRKKSLSLITCVHLSLQIISNKWKRDYQKRSVRSFL